MKSITIPSTVEFIYQEAFANCDGLENVKAKPGIPPFLYDNSFTNFSVSLEVPKGCKEDYQNAQGWKNFTNISESEKGYYKLIYMVDNEEYKSYKIEEETPITPEPAPIKEGYSFSGWSEIPETMPAHDVTVTGTFTINKYKLIYTIDGEEYKSYELDYGATITPEPAPTKEGYTFSGWSEIPATMPAHDVTVKGDFSINSYTLTYMVDGAEYKTASVEYGSTIIAESIPTKEGYTFSGWSEIPETMPAHDVTVTGSFSINCYTLTYVVDGVEYKTASVEYGSAITAETAPTKEGYTFSGWSEVPETMPAHDVTVTGSYSINSYTLTYMVDGTEYKTISVEYGSSITAETAPTKEGYTFSGWSEIPATMPAHDVTVKGNFSINCYTLTYVVDGVEYKTASVEYGSAITAETAPTKEGYTFSGWSEIPATMPAHDVTVTGSYSINSYTLTYMVDGTEYKTISIEYGSSITAETAPTKEGYTFSGWSEIPATMPAHDVTVTGTFSINSYKVTFMYGDNVLTTIEVKYGEKIELPTSLNSERYTLIEWQNVPETMPAQDIIIYADYVDGINDIAADSRDAQYIQLNGMYTTELKPGLNIIRMKDGTTKKVWVK
ncbi:MAG: InlB B-repeat-containing protein [Bacteroidaceae bacterium]|nr:InlB B-repeat-containing protein [Bacteroidaceae bacterium]